MKRAFIFDLDNTLIDTPTIGDELFAPVYKLIHSSGEHEDDFDAIKEDFTRIPFQKISEKYGFKDELISECTKVLKKLEYNKPLPPFDDYKLISNLPGDRFIVTSGFSKMQQSKLDNLAVKKDFKEVFVIDNTVTDKQKKDVLKEIIEKYNYQPEEVVIIGDDLESEIKAGNELGATTIWYNKRNEPASSEATHTISDYSQML